MIDARDKGKKKHEKYENICTIQKNVVSLQRIMQLCISGVGETHINNKDKRT